MEIIRQMQEREDFTEREKHSSKMEQNFRI